jgi:hypothetical protein
MKTVVRSLVAAPAALVLSAGTALAQATPDAAQTGVTNGFAKMQAVVDTAVPLMFVIGAIVIAAAIGMKMMRKGA